MVKGKRGRKAGARTQPKRKGISKSNGKGFMMVKGGTENKDGLEQYVHSDKKRPYNPPVGLVTPDTDKEMPKKKYSYDPHLDPQLQWAGKAEHTSFEVDTVSLHVHERIDPLTIIEKVVKEEQGEVQMSLFHYFEKPEQNPPLREAIQFYKHNQNWSNRLIAGDSLLVMTSLLQKEAMAGKVQMIYIDPPYGVKYGSNFQPFVNKRDVADGKDEDLNQEPEMIRAFRDTWELGIHSYLSYLRDRLLLSKELLQDSGSIFVQIGLENIHLVRSIMDEVFGPRNFIAQIVFVTTGGRGAKYLDSVHNILLWYAKDINLLKYRKVFSKQDRQTIQSYDWVLTPEGKVFNLSREQLAGLEPIPEGKRFALTDLTSQGESQNGSYAFEFQGEKYTPRPGRHWSTSHEGMKRLADLGRIQKKGTNIFYRRFLDDYPVRSLGDVWTDTPMGGFLKDEKKIYAVQTPIKVIERCVLMATDPGDLVFDPTCGSGTTAFVSEKWGRRWISCDTSRISIAVAKQRIITATYDYYQLAHPDEGVSSGFQYEMVDHITLGSLANNEPLEKEVIYDKPRIDKAKRRIAGPFTIEAVPSQRVLSFEESDSLAQEGDISVARSGETARMNDWLAELQITGIRGKSGQKIEFARIEQMGGPRFLHAEGETKEVEPKRIVVSFGPPYAPLEQRQVELAIEEAQKLVPKPKMIAFASFQFDPEAAKDIDELNWPGVTVLKVQMNTDLLTADLKKKRSSNESFWLIGQPDVEVKKKGKNHVVQVNGFDYYNPKTGEIESGDVSKIAMWMLDTDYDGRSLYPRQVFFPMAGQNEGWGKLAKNLRAEIDEEVLHKLFKGDVSLPFALGKNRRVGVKIIDDRGIESLKIIEVKE